MNYFANKLPLGLFFFVDNLVYRFFSEKIGLAVEKKKDYKFFFLIYKMIESEAKKERKKTKSPRRNLRLFD